MASRPVPAANSGSLWIAARLTYGWNRLDPTQQVDRGGENALSARARVLYRFSFNWTFEAPRLSCTSSDVSCIATLNDNTLSCNFSVIIHVLTLFG